MSTCSRQPAARHIPGPACARGRRVRSSSGPRTRQARPARRWAGSGGRGRPTRTLIRRSRARRSHGRTRPARRASYQQSPAKMTSTSGGSSSRTSRRTTVTRRPLALAFSSIAAAAKASISAPVASAAPACNAAIAHSPEPDAMSNTRRPATASGCSRRYRPIASPPAHANAQYGSGRVWIVRLDLDGAPQRQHLVGKIKADLLEARNGTKVGVPQDEGAGRGGYRRTLPAVSAIRWTIFIGATMQYPGWCPNGSEGAHTDAMI